jgi:lysophospholipase L1-like esterase
LFSISVGLNYYLFDFAKQYYFQLNGLRLDPLGLDSFPTGERGEEKADEVRVVFFGDSRAASWNAPAIEGFEFLNRGIGAQTSVQVRARYEEHIRPLSADILVVQVCINDLKTIPLFPTEKENIIKNCQNNIQEITTLANEDGATVILTTVFPVGQVPLERELFWSDDIAEAVVEVNGYINSLSSEQVFIFDAYTILADEHELAESFRFDELHLNSAGYEALNKELVVLLKSLEDG